MGASGAEYHPNRGRAVAIGSTTATVGAEPVGSVAGTESGSGSGVNWATANDPATNTPTRPMTRHGRLLPPGETGTGGKLDPSRSDIRHTVHLAPYHVGMDLGLTGARALVGGGSRGLGGAIAEALAAEGARVAVVARPGPALELQAERLRGLAVPADLSTADGPAAAVEAAAGAWGGLDLLVINSGGPPAGRFEDLDEAAWQRALDGTLMSAVRLLRAALPWLRQGHNPAILIVLSSSVREPIPALSTSNLIRPGLAGLLKSLVDEIAPIRINGLAPGRLATDRIGQLDAGRATAAGVDIDEIRRRTIERIPLGRYGDPSELGRVAAFLLSPAASYVTGAIVPVDGGMIRALP